MIPATEARPLPCPSWCRLNGDHTWDSYSPDTGLHHRGHVGPTFGHISVAADETSDGQVRLTSYADHNEDLTAEQWRDVARDAQGAAEWLEANR